MYSNFLQTSKFASLIIILFFAFSLSSNATTITWTGGTGSWNVASNWSTGTIPTATDEVIISSGRVTIPHHYTAYAIQVTIQHLTKLTVSSTGTLEIANTVNQDAIELYGTMVNFGDVIISNFSSTSSTTFLDIIDVYGRLINFGYINISSLHQRSRGLFVRGSVDNRGTINIMDGGRAIYLFGGLIKNRANAVIYAQDCRGAIFSTSNQYAFENYGDIIALNNSVSPGLGIIHFRTDFENNASGRIILLNNNSEFGVYLAEGTFENDGEIIIDGSDIAISNTSTFENKENGYIQTQSISNTDIQNQDIFINNGRIVLDEASAISLANNGDFENKSGGYIFFQEMTNLFGASFENKGELDQSASSTPYTGLFNYGDFTNRHCATFYIRQNISNFITGEIRNDGLMIHENTSSTATTSLNYGDMENHGILEDNTGGLYPLFDNQGIVAKELPGPLSSVEIASNALTLGSLSNYTIEGWYTSRKLGIEAGTYFPNSNAFIPNSFAAGLSTLYVKANDLTGGCSVVFEVDFSNSFSGGGNSFLSEFGGSSTSSNNFVPYPNPTTGAFHVRLPDDQEGFYELSLIDLTGRVLLKKSTADIMDATVTVTPETSLSNGSYLLQVTQNGQLINSEKVVVIR